MAGERRFTRIPPESTGDRVSMRHTAEIPYDTKDVSHTWLVGEEYTISGGGGDTFKVHVHGVYEATSTTGRLQVHYEQAAEESLYVAQDNQVIQIDTDNDDILDTVAIVNGTTLDVYLPKQNIVGYDNPEYGLNVNRFGSAQITFEDGPPEISAFGKLRTNSPKLLASYDFTVSSLAIQFVNSREGDGVTVTHEPLNGQVKLFSPAINNSRVTHTSNKFHGHLMGTGNLFIIGTRLGDTGKTNVIRRWGAFDSFDGYFFEVYETSLRVVHRYTLEGNATTDEIIEQADWNRDTLDGSGGASNPSGANVTVTESTIYWLDYQFLAGGRTRYGIFYKGQRIVCHEIDGSATTNTNSIRNPHRPLSWAQETNGGVPASSSEMFALGAGVYSESDASPLLSSQRYGLNVSKKVFAKPQDQTFVRTRQADGDAPGGAGGVLATSSYSSDTSTQYLFTLKAGQFYFGTTQENHSIYQPLVFEFDSRDVTTGQARPVEIRVFGKCIMRGTNFTWQGSKAPTVYIDTVGDHLAHGPELARFIVDGLHTVQFNQADDSFQYNTQSNTSDQSFARQLQPLSSFETRDDKYGTGVDVVRILVKDHIFFGTSIHQFDDRQPVLFTTLTGGFDFTGIFTGPNTLKTSDPGGYASNDYVTPGNENNWYYLSLLDNNDAWLYASLANLDDDRQMRVITTDAVGTTAIGDVITITSGAASGATAWVADINGLDLYVVGRSSATLDVGVTSGSFDTTTGGAAVGNIVSIAKDTSTLRDYWTSLLALKESDLGFTSQQTLSNPNLSLFSGPPPCIQWTFLARNVTDTAADEDGDTGPALNNCQVRSLIVWREKTM